MADSNTPHMDSHFFQKLTDFDAMVEQAKKIDPERVQKLIDSHQNLCDVLDELHDIIDSE